MDKFSILEGIILLGLSSLGIWEGMRLHRQQHVDVVGPGGYLAALSILLFIFCIGRLFRVYLKNHALEKGKKVPEGSRTIVCLLLALLLYGATVPIIGYALGSALFFVFAFHVSGVRSWIKSIAIGLVVAGAFELVFSHLARIPFP